MIRHRILVLGAVIALMPALTRAQYDVGPGPMAFDAGTMILNKTVFKTVLDNALAKSGKTGPSRRPAAALPKSADVTYVRSSAVTERVKRDYFDRMAKAYGGANASALRQSFATRDFVQMWAQNEASDGLRPGSLTDSIVAYWTMNWMIANGVTSTTRAQVQGLKRNLAPVLASNPSIRSMSNGQRQAFAENLMLNYVVQAMGATAAYGKKDPIVLTKMRRATVARFRQEFGVDLTTIKLTDGGIARA